MVTLQTPYRECSNAAQVYKKLIQGIKPAALDIILNEDVKEFIMKCLRSQEHRPTASELLRDLYIILIKINKINKNFSFLEINDDEIHNMPVQLLTGVQVDSSFNRSINKTNIEKKSMLL